MAYNPGFPLDGLDGKEETHVRRKGGFPRKGRWRIVGCLTQKRRSALVRKFDEMSKVELSKESYRDLRTSQ